MAKFYFNTRDNDGLSPGDSLFEYPTLRAAVEQAKTVLAEMALDGIPDGDGRCLSVEVENDTHQPIVTVSIEFKVNYPTGGGQSAADGSDVSVGDGNDVL
jgi:hypothetical protein